MTSLKRTRKILSVVLAVSLFCGAAFSQSLRRSPVRVTTTIKVADAPSDARQTESDQFVGRVVWADGFSAAVLTGPYTNFQGWDNFFYACDERLNAVAFLEIGGISHRNCRIFQVTEGTVRRGDRIFIKQIPPRESAGPESEKSES